MTFLDRSSLPLCLLTLLLVTPGYTQQAGAPTLPAPQTTAPYLPAPRPGAMPGQAAPPVETVDQLIARAEAECARGQANYAAGHLEAAKDNFDAAFNLLLRGPVSLQNDERLQAEFDKVVEATHQLELQALKVGDGFTEQRFEPAPIDEVNNITFPVDPTIKAKAQAELASTHSDLPLMLTDPVASYINYFSSRGHGTIERALTRRGRYSDMISRVFRQEGVPQDLMFLAQAESGFQPLALSRMGARGMWQFMPWDGQHAGLQRNWWVDERQDPEKATRAAARLLKDLYGQFGDWYLAMAAYNSGPGTVQRAVQRTGYADFWELYRRDVLPQETRNYVPIILAMTIMAKNPVAVWARSYSARCARRLRYGAHSLPDRSAAGRRMYRLFDGGAAGVEPQPAAHDHPQGHGLRSAPARGSGRKIQPDGRGNPRGHAGVLAIPPGGERRDAE